MDRMKSLDIINDSTEQHEYYDYDTNEKLVWYEVSLKKEELEQLKQDLKILKILKKLIKKVDYVKYKGEMRPKLFINKFSEDLEHDYEIEKIKQWLEK